MIKEDILKLFNDFCIEYNPENKKEVFKKQSEEFRQFWSERICNGGPELSEIEMDYIIRFFDLKAKGARQFRENGGECAALAGIHQKMWYKALKSLKDRQDIREILNQIFEAKDDNSKIDFVNKLEKVNNKSGNGLTGKNAIILNALLFTNSPDKYISMLSIGHRFAFIKFFGLGDLRQYKTYGEQVIKTNKDITFGFKEKYGINTTPRALSEFTYNKLEGTYRWKSR